MSQMCISLITKQRDAIVNGTYHLTAEIFELDATIAGGVVIAGAIVPKPPLISTVKSQFFLFAFLRQKLFCSTKVINERNLRNFRFNGVERSNGHTSYGLGTAAASEYHAADSRRKHLSTSRATDRDDSPKY